MLTPLVSSLTNPIPALVPAAWYQPGVGVTGTLTASNWADQSGNGRDLAQATGGNQPIYLPYSGTSYGWVPVANGNAFTCPKPSTALTGDICIKVRVAADDVTAVDRTYCGKRRAANDFQFTSGSSAKLPKFFWWQGAALKTAASTVQHSYTNGTPFWVAVTLDVDDGAGGCVAKFYTSPDGDTPSWTLLDTVTQAFTTSIDNGSGFIGVGSDESGGTATGGNFGGKFYRVQIANAADLTATPIVDFQPYAFSETSANGATATASTGEVWTLNSTGAKPAQVVKSASLLFDGTSSFMTASVTLAASTIYMVPKQISWTISDTALGGNVNGINIYQSTSTPRISLFAGSAACENSGLAVGSYGILTAVFNGAGGLTQVNANAPVTGNAGTPNETIITLGAAGGGGSNWANWQIKELIAFPAAHSAAERSRVINWLNYVHHCY